MRKIREKKCGCEKKRLSFVWLFDICGLQFGIVREDCCCLVWFWFYGLVICSLLVYCNFWIWFVALSLICVQFTFGICEHLVLRFVFGSLVLYLWERVIWVYLGFGFVRVPLHQFVLSQICYSEFCSSSLVDVGYCWTT